MSEVQPCASCTRRCMLIHQKKKHPSVIYGSFFKIMFGDRFSTVLFLPPKFAHSVSNIVDEKVDLEDASGQHWVVTSSIFEGSLAFQEGWHSFSQDHGLELGDFLVFHHIEESHFFVQIFKKSGCEQIDFPRKSSGKKRKSSKDFVAKKGSCHATYNGPIERKRSIKGSFSRSVRKTNRDNPDVTDMEIVPTQVQNTLNCGISSLRFQLQSNASYIKEPYSLMDRLLEYQEGEARSMLFDLSEFEMPKDKLCVDEPFVSLETQTKVGYQEGEVRSMLFDLYEFEMPKDKPCADEPFVSLETQTRVEYEEGEVRSMLFDLYEFEMPKDKPCADEPFVSLETQTKVEYQAGEARSLLFDLSELEMSKGKPCADETFVSLETHTKVEYREGEARSMLFDMSEFEMPKGKPCADEPVISLETHTDVGLLDLGPVAQKVLGSAVPSALSNVHMLENNGKAEATSHMLPSNKDNQSHKSTVDCASGIEYNADECDEVSRKWWTAKNSSNAHPRGEWWRRYIK